MAKPPYPDGSLKDRCVCAESTLRGLAPMAKHSRRRPVLQHAPYLTGGEGGREGGGVESRLPERQWAECRHTRDPQPHSLHSVQVSRKHAQAAQNTLQHYQRLIHRPMHMLRLTQISLLLSLCSFCSIARLRWSSINHTGTQRDSSIWDFSVCQHLHSCSMQILITLLQTSYRREEGEVVGWGQRRGTLMRKLEGQQKALNCRTGEE